MLSTVRMKGSRLRFWGRVLLSAASLGITGWAWMFYKHIWGASIPAFGSPDPYLEPLRWLLARYLLVGGGLLLAWISGLAMARSGTEGQAHQSGRQRQMG